MSPDTNQSQVAPIDGHAVKPADDVRNQPPEYQDIDLYAAEPVLTSVTDAFGAGWAQDRYTAMGKLAGSAAIMQAAHLANRHKPELQPFDRYGRRIDQVEFHPAYYQLMSASMSHALHCLPWREARPGAHVARATLFYLMSQTEQAHGCPISMTYACLPALEAAAPEIAARVRGKVTGLDYDPRFLPMEQKTSATMGMAMTEKQGGSDVRANITIARAVGPGWELTGHKWFCSAPMSDAFLTLAQTDQGLSCFYLPRFRPDGSVNRLQVNRLKDKLGNHANASSEVEFHGAYAELVGKPGRGVPAIIQMVAHTRLDCCIGAAATQRAAVAQAIHHARHRSTFGARLIDHALMQQVLADLVIEQQAATLTALRLAHAFDTASDDPSQAAFARIAVAIGKYWLCKRNPVVIAEALECLGGAGYVEEGPMPRLYREAPLNGIWEGSGNVICLDVLRAFAKDPDALPALLAEFEQARGMDRVYDRALDNMISDLPDLLQQGQTAARHMVERLALVLQAGLMLRHGQPDLAAAFVRTRLSGAGLRSFGAMPITGAERLIDLANPV
ncbi:MAG: acyl-CoA dehydrogenase family protein [Alphaproteobacteria bacterium]